MDHVINGTLTFFGGVHECYLYTAQYREMGVLLWRGETLEHLAAQLFANHKDPGKGYLLHALEHTHTRHVLLHIVDLTPCLDAQVASSVFTMAAGS